MKFAAALRNSAEELPDAAELFTLYKHLKKSLKRIPCGDAGHDDSSLVADPASEFGEAASGDEDEADTALELPSLDASAATLADSAQDAAAALDEGERAFVAELTRDVEQLNEQYMEKEEVNVIRFGTLKDQAAAARSRQELQRAYRAVVDFHGELLLVLHWSILAYTGLVKILKKHHKRTGLLLRAPHLTNMLGQPFCSVEVTVLMVSSAEQLVSSLARVLGEAEGATSVADAEVHHGSSLSADSHVCGSSAGGLAAPGDGPGCHTEPRHKRRREPARMGEGAMSEGSAGGGRGRRRGCRDQARAPGLGLHHCHRHGHGDDDGRAVGAADGGQQRPAPHARGAGPLAPAPGHRQHALHGVAAGGGPGCAPRAQRGRRAGRQRADQQLGRLSGVDGRVACAGAANIAPDVRGLCAEAWMPADPAPVSTLTAWLSARLPH